MQLTRLSFVLLLSSLCGICFSQTHPYAFSQFQAMAVDSLLADSSDSRLAVTSDCDTTFFSDYQKENPDYTPYFIESDFDGDGLKDFVIALKHGKDYSVFLFRATRAGYLKPQLLVSLDWLNQCGFFAEGEGMFQIAQFPLLGYGIVFKWDKKSETLKYVEVPRK
jgi:hypothetical protein